MLPTYYFTLDEVATDLLVDEVERDDGSRYFTVEAEGIRAVDAARTHPYPHDDLAPLADRLTFDWFGELDWFEEEEPLFAHARDPHKRVDVAPSSRHVVVEIDGQVVAESSSALLLFETMLPTRYYLNQDDVRMDLLTPTEFTSLCPYKGKANYWSADVGDDVHENIAWTYRNPIPESPRIRNLVCFFNEKVDLTVDGELQERPITPWS